MLLRICYACSAVKYLYQWQGLRLPVAVASRRQGKVMQVLVAARSYMCLWQGTVVQMLQ